MRQASSLYPLTACVVLLHFSGMSFADSHDERTAMQSQNILTVAEERVEIAREQTLIAREAAALEQRRAVLAERLESLAKREARQSRRFSERASDRTSQLEEQLSELRAQETERGLTLTLGDVSFESGEAKLTPEAMKKLYALVTVLKENPSRNIVIEGHTDSTGTQAANQDLSQKRAEAVRDFLIAGGVNPDRAVARGYGEAYPVATNTSGDGRRENRRVEVVILNEGERIVSERR